MTIPSNSRRKSKYEARVATGGPATSAMIASLEAEGYETVSAPFGHVLVEAAKANPKIVGLTADISKYTDLHVFADAFPHRFFQMGMAEQSMISAAAGLAREGFTPFATTYAVFASRRAYDFICMAIAEEALPVKIVYPIPGWVFLTGVQLGASMIRGLTGGIELLPGLILLPFDAELDPLYDLPEDKEALVDWEGPINVRFGVDYISPGYF